MPDFFQMTIRIPSLAGEALRQAAFSSRLQPAVLARLLLVEAINEGRLPPPAPPAPGALAPEARALLAAMAATQSNLSQLSQHALELGTPLAQLATPGGPLAEIGERIRQIGIALKTGAPAPSNTPALIATTDQINSLTRRLNMDRLAVPLADWHAPLTSIRSALPEVN